MTAASSHRSFIWLDVARALAAMVVLAGHLRAFVFDDSISSNHLNLAWKAFYFITGIQHQAVVVFFILSGFLISRTISEQFSAGKWSWRLYAIKRVSRLWIVLLPALVLTLFWDQLGMRLTGSDLYSGALNSVNHSTPITASSYSPLTFIGNIFFLQTIAVPEFGTDVPLWSLANEFWYYVVFPLLFFALRPFYSMSSRIALLSLAAILCIWVVPSQLMLGLVWLMGYGAYLLERRFGKFPHSMRLYAAVGAAVLFAAILIESKLFKISDAGQDFITGAAFALLLVPLAGLDANAIFAKWSRLFAGFSYTLYVTHFPFLAFATSMFARNLRVEPGAQGLLTFSILFVAVMLYAYIVSVAFERNTPVFQTFILRYVPSARVRHRAPTIALGTD